MEIVCSQTILAYRMSPSLGCDEDDHAVGGKLKGYTSEMETKRECEPEKNMTTMARRRFLATLGS